MKTTIEITFEINKYSSRWTNFQQGKKVTENISFPDDILDFTTIIRPIIEHMNVYGKIMAREGTDFAEDKIEEKTRKWRRTVLRSVFVSSSRPIVRPSPFDTKQSIGRLGWMDVARNTRQLMNRAHSAI